MGLFDKFKKKSLKGPMFVYDFCTSRDEGLTYKIETRKDTCLIVQYNMPKESCMIEYVVPLMQVDKEDTVNGIDAILKRVQIIRESYEEAQNKIRDSEIIGFRTYLEDFLSKLNEGKTGAK
jgi:hypothetical protein